MLLRFIALLALATLQLSANGSVWKIQNSQGATIYLGGTIHLLRSQDYPLPKAYEYAYQQSQLIVFETTLNDPSMGEYMSKVSLYPNGVELKDKLSSKTYQALEAYTQKVGYPLILISRMRVSLAMFSLSLHKFQEMGFYPSNGVDQHFYTRATKDHKRILSFETPKEQIDMVVGIGEEQEDKMVEYTLKDLERLNEYFTPIFKAWRVGNRKQINKHLVEDMKNYPQIYQRLLVDRNRKWIDVITKEYFSSKEVEFILVGAGHLVGQEGLLHYFETHNYHVEQVK